MHRYAVWDVGLRMLFTRSTDVSVLHQLYACVASQWHTLNNSCQITLLPAPTTSQAEPQYYSGRWAVSGQRNPLRSTDSTRSRCPVIPTATPSLRMWRTTMTSTPRLSQCADPFHKNILSWQPSFLRNAQRVVMSRERGPVTNNTRPLVMAVTVFAWDQI